MADVLGDLTAVLDAALRAYYGTPSREFTDASRVRMARALTATRTTDGGRTLTVDLDTGAWVFGGPLQHEDGFRVASAVLPGMPAEEIERAYARYMSDDKPVLASAAPRPNTERVTPAFAVTDESGTRVVYAEDHLGHPITDLRHHLSRGQQAAFLPPALQQTEQERAARVAIERAHGDPAENRRRVIQSNDVAAIVQDKAGSFVPLVERYNVADALYEQGYRRVLPVEAQALDTLRKAVEIARDCIEFIDETRGRGVGFDRLLRDGDEDALAIHAASALLGDDEPEIDPGPEEPASDEGATAEALAKAWDDGVRVAGGYGHEDTWTHDVTPYSENPFRGGEPRG